MSISIPYRRTVRQLSDGSYADSGHGRYVSHKKYASDAWHYKRAFQIIDADLSEIFTYIEPSCQNFPCFSYKISGLLTRICIEIEANFKAILKENAYNKAPSDMTMADYKKVERSHLLSAYEIRFAVWYGQDAVFQPFLSWGDPTNPPSPVWYKAYNSAKHDRHANFAKFATFEHLLDAYCGLAVLIWSQFRDASNPGPVLLSLEQAAVWPGFDFGPLDSTLIKPPVFSQNERYDFDWQAIGTGPDPFQSFPY